MRSAVDPSRASHLHESGEEAFSGPLTDVAAADLELAAVLGALSDPLRLRIVATLADGCEWSCGSLELPIAKSTKSHHLRVLGEAGIVSRRVDGKCRMLRLRREALDQRFPGLLDAILAAEPTAPMAATGGNTQPQGAVDRSGERVRSAGSVAAPVHGVGSVGGVDAPGQRVGSGASAGASGQRMRDGGATVVMGAVRAAAHPITAGADPATAPGQV